jgi:hypothetical protein
MNALPTTIIIMFKFDMFHLVVHVKLKLIKTENYSKTQQFYCFLKGLYYSDSSYK